MPPSKKKGGSSGPFATLWSIFCFPVSLARRIVFYPVDLLMYVLVDMLGDPKWWPWWEWKNKLVAKPYWKETILYAKEFRYVLYAFGWPSVPSPVWRCKFCSKEGKVWCVECKKKFCPQCAYNHHAPGMTAQNHSLEEFVDDKRHGVHWITPIFAEALFVGFILYAMYGSPRLIQEDYMSTQRTCPIVSKARSMVAYYDVNIFYHFKEHFASGCDMEESFFRFITDAWVRTVVTGTDNTLLVFQTLPQALFFDVVLMYTIVPVLASTYAFVFNLFYQLELMIPATDTTRNVERIIRYFNFLEVFGSGDYSKRPPETKLRRRPSLDPYEAFNYHKDRKLRVFSYYYEETTEKMQRLIWSLLVWVMVFRLAVLWFGLAPLVRSIASTFGFAGTVTRHGQWFHAFTNTVVREERLWDISVSIKFVVMHFFKTTPATVWRFTIMWLLISVCCVVLFFKLCNYLLSKRRAMMGKFLGDAVKFERGTISHGLNFGQAKLLTKAELPYDPM